MRLYKFCLGMAITIWITACNKPTTTEQTNLDTKLLAKVEGQTLLLADIADLLPANISHTDSLQRMERYAQSWVLRQLLIKSAAKEATAKNADIDKRVEDYKNTLILQAYEQQYVSEKLDTNISEADIEKFYQANATNFVLRYPLVKAVWIVLPTDAPKKDKITAWLKSSSATDRQELRSYCIRFAEQSIFQDSVWVAFDELVAGTPFSEVANKNEFVRSNSLSQKQDDSFIYVLKIADYKISGQTAPLAYIANQVKGIILNQRKTELLKALSDDVYQQAKKDNAFEILVKP